MSDLDDLKIEMQRNRENRARVGDLGQLLDAANKDAARLYRALVLANETIAQKLGYINHPRIEALEEHEKRLGADMKTLMKEED